MSIVPAPAVNGPAARSGYFRLVSDTNTEPNMHRLLTCLCLLALATPAHAEHVDVELDPLAYALGGHSVHVGVGFGRFRFDLGAFGLDLPDFAEEKEGFSTAFSGVGVKAHYYLFAEQTGGFVGLGAGRMELLVQKDGSDLAHRETVYSAGPELGWRFALGENLHLTPWIGLDRTFDPVRTTLGGARYEQPEWSIFPTVHLGWRFR